MYRVKLVLNQRGKDYTYDIPYHPILLETGRKREARGLCKMMLHSQMEVLIKHDIELNGDEIIQMGEEGIFRLQLVDKEGVWYDYHLMIEELCSRPGHKPYLSCGTYVCGMCYEKNLLFAPLTKHKSQVTFVDVYDATIHRYRSETIPYVSH